MERLLNVQTALSLGYVGLMVGTAYVASRVFLPASASVKTRSIFLWLAFDAICHLTLEGSFLYLSLQGRTVNTSKSFFGYLWQEYAAADSRWGTADATVVALEYLTVLIAGPMAAYCCYLLAIKDPIYHYWAVVLSTGEIYGGFMTFAPEWLTGSPNLDISNWLLLWMYLVLMNTVWVLIPLWLMIDSFGYIAKALRASAPAGKASKSANTKQSAAPGGLSSTHGLSGTAYTLLLAVIFLYIMPTASASSVTTESPAVLSMFPEGPFAETVSMWDSLKSVAIPLLLPGMLLSMSLFAGAIQVAESSKRKINRTNKTRRRKILQELGINEKQEIEDGRGPRTILGFFHPYCNAGGGGERVLYEAIRHHQAEDERIVIAIYTGDFPAASISEILDRASSRFGVKVNASTIALIPLARRWMIEDDTYDHFTLLGQCWGSIWLGFEAMASLIPDVYIDTMGYAFTYPVVRWFSSTVPVGGYVHYPVISTDMLNRVAKREHGHTNQGKTANSSLRTSVKLIYYRILARVYGWTLRRADALVVNGSWTQNHINHLLNNGFKPFWSTSKTRKAHIVYPPCDTTQLAAFPLQRDAKLIVSLAQFRPEKEHPTQLYILQKLLEKRPDLSRTRLIMMGSSRNKADETRISLLRALAAQLGVADNIEFVVNAPFTQVMQHLSKASVGLSTMKDEHFGINVVEFMAAGLITLSHKSAGPYLDIAIPVTSAKEGEKQATGFHALSIDEFAEKLAHILDMDPESQALPIRKAARQRAVETFGQDGFTSSWDKLLWEPLNKSRRARASATK